MVVQNADGGSIADCGSFVPEKHRDETVSRVLALMTDTYRR